MACSGAALPCTTNRRGERTTPAARTQTSRWAVNGGSGSSRPATGRARNRLERASPAILKAIRLRGWTEIVTHTDKHKGAVASTTDAVTREVVRSRQSLEACLSKA